MHLNSMLNFIAKPGIIVYISFLIYFAKKKKSKYEMCVKFWRKSEFDPI